MDNKIENQPSLQDSHFTIGGFFITFLLVIDVIGLLVGIVFYDEGIVELMTFYLAIINVLTVIFSCAKLKQSYLLTFFAFSILYLSFFSIFFFSVLSFIIIVCGILLFYLFYRNLKLGNRKGAQISAIILLAIAIIIYLIIMIILSLIG